MKRNINEDIKKLKDIITNLFLSYNKLSSKESEERRKSEDLNIYKDQQLTDLAQIVALRNHALKIFDLCNEILM